MKKLFGTDGIRAVAGQFPLDYPSIHALGTALVGLLREEGLAAKALIGRDTRESGTWMEQALAHGIRDGGGRAVSAGVIPTSSISYLTQKHIFSAGIVISASHNPYQDNGIKIFSSRGTKISDAWEARLEQAVLAGKKPIAEKKTKVRLETKYLADYKRFLKGRFAHVRAPRGMKVVLDCSNGASFEVAPEIMRELGFDVVAIGNKPNGKNINAGCGSLHLHALARTVAEVRAAVGIAYDGDADRALWVDENGRFLNGDHTLYILARFMKEKGRLKSRTVVATSMTNMGLETALRKMGLALVRTRVGDKYVLEKMLEIRSNLGGEQSGHTILIDECPTGDGILTSLRMLEVMVEKKRPLSSLVRGLVEYPQILLNVPVAKKLDFKDVPEIAKAVAKVQRLLKDRGRLDVRYSGTEPLARVMVEGEELKLIQKCGQGIAEAIKRNLGTS
jgi:phosphoglucosamine mutase